MKKTLKQLGLLSLLITSFIACDKDYNDIGTDLLVNSTFHTDSVEYPVLTYNKAVNPVRSSNLTSNLLGVYKDPNYGGYTSASFVAQLIPSSFNPDFGLDPVIDSVLITLPYYSTDTGEDYEDEETGDSYSTYKIDSLYGDAPIKLSIYENTYYLRTYDPATNLEEAQLYYSNSNSTINFNDFEGQLIYENDEFLPDPTEILIKELNTDTDEWEVSERLSPSLRITFSSENTDDDAVLAFWSDLLFSPAENGNTEVLSNANNFIDYFRGLYFKAESTTGDGNMFLFDATDSDANITVYYSYTDLNDEEDSTDDEILSSNYTLTFSGNKVNVIENNLDTTFSDGDNINGDETLYLKGMEGSMAVIKLFGDPDPTTGANVAFNNFKQDFENRLINEANLVIYVDQDLVQGDEPDRIYLYDLNNNLYISDYYNDPTTSTSYPLISKLFFSKFLERDDNDKGIKYKFRITEHLNNILLRDSTNFDLGLTVTTNINSSFQVQLDETDDDSDVQTYPLGAFLSPKGTILYGGNENVPEDKRIKLEIFYSELED